VIEVHPPEHGIHGWRDFLAHMGIIVLGLMIALGLEQSAEWVHHRHELRELHQGLRQETESNIANVQISRANMQADAVWLGQRIGQVAEALQSRGAVAPEPPLPKHILNERPADPAWSAAKFGGLLAIVPQDEIKAYSEVDGMIAEWNTAHYDADAATSRAQDFETSFCAPKCPADFSLASPGDLREYIRLLQEERVQFLRLARLDLYLFGAENAILHGERDIGRIQAAETQPMPTAAGAGSK
jgi:hypothetical protein